MRNLKDWLGHKVLVIGVITKMESNSYCITDVRVKEYSNSSEIRSIDHINTFFTEKEMEVYDEIKKTHPKKVPKLNEKVGFIGKVIKYYRRNGTEDYGIESIPSIGFSIKCKGKVPILEREKLVLNIISLLKRKEIFYDFEKCDYQSYLKELYDLLKEIRLELAVIKYSKDKALESINKTRRGKINPDPVKFKSKRLKTKTSTGFKN